MAEITSRGSRLLGRAGTVAFIAVVVAYAICMAAQLLRICFGPCIPDAVAREICR